MHKKFLALIMLISAFSWSCQDKNKLTVGEQISETIVYVNQSSGVIVYSDEERSLVLTAYHVIADNCDSSGSCNTDEIKVSIVYPIFLDKETKIRAREIMEKNGTSEDIINLILDNEFIQIPEFFSVVQSEVDPSHDLAILEIKTSLNFRFSNLSKKECKVGDDVYLAGNPNRLFRTILKGTVGSIDRFIDNTESIQISGGTIFGSSGGGVFNLDGELIGIIQSVRALVTPYCYGEWNEDGDFVKRTCVELPVEFLGFAAKEKVIIDFLSESRFCLYFKICK